MRLLDLPKVTQVISGTDEAGLQVGWAFSQFWTKGKLSEAIRLC